ncbi:hypothetical protein BDV26DRAFT_48735 [Aspergillus bertholletiae]|uniref:Six-hairpin glycosidase-like protein n=1 Tax=Aspergillus bertholletiae TaxID=1226010 RepID=A0A5N7BJG4_9EURO|nr:hypothetical protein BDV26DRAFT_48735 [Aspergillus bertholletiae]
MRRLSLWAALGALVSEVLSQPTDSRSSDTVKVHWVGDAPEYHAGTTFGLPWPQGKYRFNETQFTISGQSKEPIPLQSWVTGYWRDGSIKWTGHAIPPLDTIGSEYRVSASASRRPASNHSSASAQLKVADKANEVIVDTGKLTASFPKQGNVIVGSITTSNGKVVGQNGKLLLHTQSGIAEDVSARANASINYFNFQSNIEDVSVSKENTVRTLVTVKGKHQTPSSGDHDDWLPFVLRFYFYANSDSIRVVHSIIFDGKPEEDFITGLGIQFEVPLEGEELYNRHIRLPGVDGGYLNEAVQGITGLRRDPGEEVRSAQYEGKVTPNISTWDARVSSRMQWIPVWNDYKLSQLSPDGFTLKKRTKPGQAWINIPGGTRSSGLAYLGGATQGGLAIGLRDFWKRYPSGLDITNAGANKGQITLWLYSPEAAPLDLRPFHDGLGQDTYKKQTDALEITYEDYEPGFNTPYGIARTSEIFLHAFDATPESDALGLLSKSINEPPVLVPKPEYIKETKAAGSYWALPDTSNDKSSIIEEHLDFLAKFYQGQIEDRRWYGFLDYGDIMHTYDEDRHTWRYDIGGYAWDNSELSPDLFFWQYFLRTGRADIYRFAEALTRHTGEVDVYHIGDWKGLGTRHGVQHFADSAKQVRIAQPQYRKYFYYLSGGDERVGELLEEAIDADKTYGILDPQRKVRTDGWTPEPGKPVAFSLGTDWAGLAAGWLIEWERRGPRWQEARKKLTGTAKGIASFKNGFVTGAGLYAISNGTLLPPPTDPNNEGVVSISHLNAVFGMPEVISELLEYWGDDAPDGLKSAWLDYCYYYGATKAEQKARYGESFSGISLIQGHSRLTAYYANHSNNVTVAERAWKEFYNNTDGFTADEPWVSEPVNGTAVLIPVDEASWISTNAVAQYGLAAIQDLALVGDAVTQSPYGA